MNKVISDNKFFFTPSSSYPEATILSWHKFASIFHANSICTSYSILLREEGSVQNILDQITATSAYNQQDPSQDGPSQDS